MKLYFKGYDLILSRKAIKSLRYIDKISSKNIRKKIKQIVLQNIDFDAKKMKGYKSRFRLRCGVYRVIFDVQNKVLVLLVVDVGHRRKIYKHN